MPIPRVLVPERAIERERTGGAGGSGAQSREIVAGGRGETQTSLRKPGRGGDSFRSGGPLVVSWTGSKFSIGEGLCEFGGAVW